MASNRWLWERAFLATACAILALGHGADVHAAESPQRILCLSGSDWMIHEDSQGTNVTVQFPVAVLSKENGWVPATVPGNIQADLETAQLLKPLWYGAGDPRLYDVARKDWWYRKDFTVPASFAGKRLTLVFDGVDHQCDVWLNGKQIGSNAGMFRRFWFDVAELAQPGETNHLAVRIAKMPDQLAPLVVSSDSELSSGFIGCINRTRQALKELKSPTNFGWDWGVNIWTLGIWKDVSLVATGPARIDWTQVRITLNTNYTKAAITATLEVESLSEQPIKAVFKVSGNGQQASAMSGVNLKKGKNQVEAELSLDKPGLWWCNGQGQQPLYTLEARLEPPGGGPPMDTRSTRFGIREAKWVHTEGAPKDYVSRFQLVLNGRPVRTMGSCMVPPDLLFGRACPRGRQLLRRARDDGMNMIRMWGGGVILPDEFYALADELGLMLSVEFPIANCKPETDAVFLGNLETTTRNIVKQLRNHPSIIEYTGGNEMSWNSLTKHPAWEIFQKIVSEDDGRLVRATCPDLGARHSPWDFDISSSYRHYNTNETMRYGEFGTSSPANLEVWHRTIPPGSQWPIRGVGEPILIRKNVVQAVFSPEHWLLKSRIDRAFGSFDSLPEVIEAGQFLGAEGLRYAMDANRRKGKRMGGFTSWDFNEPWPNGAGSYVVDYDGRPLMNYDFVKQALAPISLSLKYDSLLYEPVAGVNLELWLVSDAPRTVRELQWRWLARDRRGTVFDRDRGAASIAPLEVRQLGKLKLTPPKETALGPIFVEMQLSDSRGKLLTERVHVFGAAIRGSLGGLLVNREEGWRDGMSGPAQGEKSIAQASLALGGNGAEPARASVAMSGHQAESARSGIQANQEPRCPVWRTTLVVSLKPVRKAGGWEVLDLVVKNTGTMTALFCEPHPLLEYRTDLFIDNNHCFIPPGESRTVAIRAAPDSQGGLTLAQTGWWISTWNADDLVIEPSDQVLLALGRRDAMTREYLGYTEPSRSGHEGIVELCGRRPAPEKLPLVQSGGTTRFEFTLARRQTRRGAHLRIHTADQSQGAATAVEARLNGELFSQVLSAGLGIQKTEPAQLAFPQTLVFAVPTDSLRAGKNLLEIRVKNGGWFTWDALDLVSD